MAVFPPDIPGVYEGQARNYTLFAIDQETGIYELDENNGIVLPMNYKGHILSGLFRAGNSFLITRMEFNGKYWCMSKSLFLIDF